MPLFASAIAGSMCLPEPDCTWADVNEGVAGRSEGTGGGGTDCTLGPSGLEAPSAWLLLFLLLLSIGGLWRRLWSHGKS